MTKLLKSLNFHRFQSLKITIQKYRYSKYMMLRPLQSNALVTLIYNKGIKNYSKKKNDKYCFITDLICLGRNIQLYVTYTDFFLFNDKSSFSNSYEDVCMSL